MRLLLFILALMVVPACTQADEAMARYREKEEAEYSARKNQAEYEERQRNVVIAASYRVPAQEYECDGCHIVLDADGKSRVQFTNGMCVELFNETERVQRMVELAQVNPDADWVGPMSLDGVVEKMRSAMVLLARNKDQPDGGEARRIIRTWLDRGTIVIKAVRTKAVGWRSVLLREQDVVELRAAIETRK